MKPALAIFVKTPGYSPVKTRLARDFGEARATAFHLRAAVAVQAVAEFSRNLLESYWAVAEQRALHRWTGFPVLWQGDGGLGERLHTIYSKLQVAHGRVLLIGADAPQITREDLQRALQELKAASFVLGPSADGGFWLFGGRRPLPAAVWTDVRYSVAGTAAELNERLAPHGLVSRIATLADVDSAADLEPLCQSLAHLPAPLTQQRDLLDWLREHAAIGDTLPTTHSKEVLS